LACSRKAPGPGPPAWPFFLFQSGSQMRAGAAAPPAGELTVFQSLRPIVQSSAGQRLPLLDRVLRPGYPWEGRLRLWLAVALLAAGVTCAHAQQTITPVTPPPSLPSTFPQFQTYSTCLMNCDTRVGSCQSSCSFPSVATSTQTTIRPDPGALTQCYISCTSQALLCKQACRQPQ
jgi:hypothetical protein